ncbi:RipA family octameric membrane protein [[Kitasatospora] papulosa]
MEEDNHSSSDQRSAQDERLWEHALHENGMVFQRGNLFLVAQSLLAVAYSTILVGADHRNQGASGSQIIAVFGLALAAIWLYVGHRHLRYCELIRERARARLPEYAETRAAWNRRGPGSLPLITYVLPALAGIMWIFLLVEI